MLSPMHANPRTATQTLRNNRHRTQQGQAPVDGFSSLPFELTERIMKDAVASGTDRKTLALVSKDMRHINAASAQAALKAAFVKMDNEGYKSLPQAQWVALAEDARLLAGMATSIDTELGSRDAAEAAALVTQRDSFLELHRRHRSSGEVGLAGDLVSWLYDGMILGNKTPAAGARLFNAYQTQADCLDLGCFLLPTLDRAVGRLTFLRTLLLNDNQLTELPDSLGQLSALCVLNVANNYLITLPESLGQLQNLVALDACNNQLAAIPKSMGQNSKLKVLALPYNRIRALPANIGMLTALEILNVSYNALDEVGEEISHLKQLKFLQLGSNPLAALPSALGRLNSLISLDVHATLLHELPPELGELTELQELSIARTQIASLPETITNMTKLRCVWVTDCFWHASLFKQLNAQVPHVSVLAQLPAHEGNANQGTV
jgi:hypothetical protein